MNDGLVALANADGTGETGGWLTTVLLEFARGGAEWVLWLLVVLSFVSIALMIERIAFYSRNRTDPAALRSMLVKRLDNGEIEEAVKALRVAGDSMECHVLLHGLEHFKRGPTAVQELMAAAVSREKIRYSRFLNYQATLGVNAPFIGLFGTVLGVIQAFDGLSTINMSDATAANDVVMGPIAEALIATGVGLLVAIPAVVAFNVFRSRVKKTQSNTEVLARTVIAFLKEDKPDHGVS